MKTISGLFDTSGEARAAVDALQEAGVASADISVIGSEDSASADDAAEGVGVGAAIGGVGGLLAGLGAVAIPGIGPLVGTGWLVATLAGAAAGGLAGGLIGSLTAAGVSERDAHVYAEGIKRGGTMVVARIDDTQEDATAAILGQHGRVDITSRREQYEAEGWTRFQWPRAEDDLIRPADDPAPPVFVPPPNR
jgi:hypothetical protein